MQKDKFKKPEYLLGCIIKSVTVKTTIKYSYKYSGYTNIILEHVSAVSSWCELILIN